MENSVINPSFTDLALTGIFFSIVIFLSVREQLQIEKTFIYATIRAVVQLLLVGYLIERVFSLDRWYWVLLLLVTMSLIAANAGSQRIISKIKHLSFFVWIAVFTGTLLNTFIVTEIILKIDPWWEPRYLLPLAGMIMGNALNSGSLAGERFISEMRNRKSEIETMLILGFSSAKACGDMKRTAIKNSLIPTLNAMFTVGLVHLPGMMTGQILGGVNPIIASKYQIVVMLMVSSTVVVTSLILVNLLQRQYFSNTHQIKQNLF